MRPLSGLFLLFFALSSEVGLAHEIPRCGDNLEYNVELKRCTESFSRDLCPRGRARYLGFCSSAEELQLNANFDVSSNVTAGLTESGRSQARQANVSYEAFMHEYQAHLSQQRIRAEEAASVTPPEPAPAAVAEGTSSPNPTPAPEPEETVSDNQDNLEESFDVFDPDQCEWVPDMPRKVHEAPGCRRSSRTKVCVGYVACKLREGEGRFIRASTCSTQHCGDGPANASACTKDPGFWSNNVDESSPKYINQEIRNLINRASRQ